MFSIEVNDSNSTHVTQTTQRPIPLIVQIIAWSFALIVGIAGMLGFVAEWDEQVASIQVVLLALAPLFFMLSTRRTASTSRLKIQSNGFVIDYVFSVAVGLISFLANAWVGTQIGDLPPLYHDEYSYLFQTETLLNGKFSTPSSPVHPELFDQMHVLNEGRMASRYYPGTGLWMMLFVATGHPYLGHWLASAFATTLLYWTGREIGGRTTACIAAISMAVSPGIALFGNLLLAHQPTLVGEMVFLLGITRWLRTRSGREAFLAGCGLSYAMLCRPMTAAGFGLPFGITVLWWLFFKRTGQTSGESNAHNAVDKRATLLGLAIPLMVGWSVMLAYNKDITGEWLTSPYQLYTDTYTPRHVYGFNNRLRGESRLGPKVIDHYDQWAENLTPKLALSNSTTRLLASWIWTSDFLLLFITTVILFCTISQLDLATKLVCSSIISLHAVHVPYWYVGIMGWHYVFESAPLWCILLGSITGNLFVTWRSTRRNGLKYWWMSLLSFSMLANLFAPQSAWKIKLSRGIDSIRLPRLQQAEFQRWIAAAVGSESALILIDQTETEASHLDYVVNHPGLSDQIVLGRFTPGKTNPAEIATKFPDRRVFLCNPRTRMLQRIERPR